MTVVKRQDIRLSEFKGGHFSPSEDFAKTFPKMASLLQQTLTVDFKINHGLRFRQYIWTRADGSTVGWVCRVDHCVPQGRNIIDEHQLLANELGGIIQTWVDKPYEVKADTLIKNNNFTFCLSDSAIGFGGWEEKYIEQCKKEGVKPLNSEDFVTFALESNGNATFYHKETKDVYIYLHDGYAPFDNTIVEGQPEYSIHQLDKAKGFVEYVELLASQWLDIIK
ncbi:hypothetical protein [Dysgonomonas macrotermitis]|uniref:Uncharacterized protein n=1 Tax=Dysgonomonas macrotermitis TaxID=1346286 RepID=A0A1M5HST7_9BACT|nr:hypothetical protein [Dysgonomonas macrotermitis]SHG18983.1 hypothetical protein SAMN05444362_11725 [Dysgonomonas macrotermitis]